MNPQQYTQQNGQGGFGGPQMILPGQQLSAEQQNILNQQRMTAMGNASMQQGIGSAAMTANQMAPNKDLPTSTQSTLLISEIRDNMVVMKDGSFRAVVACKSINFDLMSDMEREGVEVSYQNFLNSLTFTTQILIRSQKVDIGPYIEKLINNYHDQFNIASILFIF